MNPNQVANQALRVYNPFFAAQKHVVKHIPDVPFIPYPAACYCVGISSTDRPKAEAIR